MKYIIIQAKFYILVGRPTREKMPRKWFWWRRKVEAGTYATSFLFRANFGIAVRYLRLGEEGSDLGHHCKIESQVCYSYKDLAGARR